MARMVDGGGGGIRQMFAVLGIPTGGPPRQTSARSRHQKGHRLLSDTPRIKGYILHGVSARHACKGDKCRL